MSVTPATSGEVEQFVGARPRSQAAYERAQRVLPGGVAQQMRSMRPFPITIAQASGARKWDVDGHEYIDYHFGSGALLRGHAHRHGHPRAVRGILVDGPAATRVPAGAARGHRRAWCRADLRRGDHRL